MKWSASIEYVEQTDEIIRHALRVCQTGTPGPVYIEYPSHVINQDIEVKPALPPAAYRLVQPGADGQMVAKAAELIKNAECPIILTGHAVQCSRAGQKVRELAELMGCPVLQTSGGNAFIEGIEERTFPYLFAEVADEIVAKSDVVVAIGTEIGEPMHFGRGFLWAEGNVDRKWISIELDPEAIGQNRPIDVPLVGDLHTVVPQLSAALKDSPRAEHPDLQRWIKEDKDRLAALAKQDFSTPSGRVHTGQWVVESTAAMPENAIHVRDGGGTVVFTWTYLQGKPTVIHVPIDPVINHGGNQNLDTPNYARFRTWYAEGQQ